MTEKLWFQHGESVYKATIPAEIDCISDLVTLIHENPIIRNQLRIPTDGGALTLLRSTGAALDVGLTLEELTSEDGFLNDRYHPMVVQVQPKRHLFEDDESLENSRKQRRTQWKVTTLGQLSYNPSSVLFELHSEYLANTGLPTKPLLLYCRDSFHEQFKFLRDRVMDNCILGWILGPPGTGKSTTALAFASVIDRKKWTITWIHLNRTKYPECVRLEGDSKKCRTIQDNNIYELFDILDEVDASKHHIVFIDGYVLNGHKHIDIQKACYSWLEKDKDKRRLVVICSMSSRYKAKIEEDQLLKLEEFFVFSWKIEEYLAAVDDDDFFNGVKHILDSSNTTNENETTNLSRKTMISSKFYFSGGCSRFMFQYTTKEVISYLQASVEEIEDMESYVNATIGARSNGVINRLFGLSNTGKKLRGSKSYIISQFAGFSLAVKLGPALVKHLAKAISHDSNPAIEGWLLEMWFFASLRNGGIKFITTGGNRSIEWPEAVSVEVLDFDACPPSLPDVTGTWFKPQKWNQGGFDAVFFYSISESPDITKHVVRFVQVTSGENHSFKIEYFHKLLKVLGNHFEIHTIEIFFIVEEKNLANFKIVDSQITGQGLLHSFGWKKGKEKENVQIIGIKGWR